ncbi:MAG: chaperone modulator CbpM, partial [Alphaproteobacteria bacterium]
MLELDEVARLAGVRRTELVTWIDERWVLPVEEDGRWRFAEVDVARVRLIVELRRDLDIGPDALPVVLSLMDRVNALRRGL